MGQAILAGIILIALKLIWDIYKDKQTSNKASGKKAKQRGEVIDLSDAWIDMSELPYHKKETFLSGKELNLYQSLKDILPVERYSVFPRVRLADFLSVDQAAHNRQEYLTRIKERSADFLVCELPDLKPVLVITVDNQVEARKKQFSERFNRRATEASGLSLVIINALEPLSDEELKQKIQRAGIQI